MPDGVADNTSQSRPAIAPLVCGMSSGAQAKRRGELIDLVTSLRSLGAQAELDLPRIVCIGNQSAGKSSLVEAISGIQVPRDSGTCTRCPLECRLSPSSEEWSARVSLRREWDDATKSRLPNPDTVAFGSLISAFNETELVLRRAQLAILNPNRPVEDFVNMDLMSEDSRKQASRDCELEFSNNVICIDIWAPNLAQLVFIDLPGVIQNADQRLVDLIESMVTEYIRGNSIILVAIPMTDDMQNQKAARMAKIEDPEGVRTVVALTKVDLVGAASTKLKQTWLNAIEGHGEHPLKHGYFGTRQLDDGERERTSLSQARALERKFFAETPPWSTSQHTSRFGIPNLTEKLSLLLAESIQKSLPRIHEDLRVALSNTAKRLQEYPSATTGEPASEVLNFVDDFCKDLKRLADGERGTEQLVQANHAEFLRFKNSILETAPNFQPFKSATAAPEVQNTQGDDVRRQDPIYLDDLKGHIKKARTRELPGNIPYAAILTLIQKFTNKWAEAAGICIENVRENVLLSVKTLIDKRFRRFPTLELAAREIIMEEVEKHYQKIKEIMDILLNYESIPYTQNEDDFKACWKIFLGYYKSGHAPINMASMTTAPQSSVVKADLQNRAVTALNQLGYRLTVTDLDRLVLSHEYEEEMQVASQVGAFFNVSHKRIIDMIPMSIDHMFLRAVSKDMQRSLTSRLDISDKEKAENYLVEDPGVAAIRRDLMMHMDKLEKARDQLSKFGSFLSA